MDLYLGNLDFNVNENDVRYLVEEFAPVEKIKMIVDFDRDGCNKGFCFVAVNEQIGESVIKSLDGKEFHGRILKCNEARRKV